MPDSNIDPLRLILAGSSAALAAFVILSGLRLQKPLRTLIGGAVLCGGLWIVYSITFPSEAISRGDRETPTLVLSYVAMVLGMMAQYVYAKSERGETKLNLEWMPFVTPILASPIVFIPLVSIAGEVSTGDLFSRARVMVYLVAFQNGFFWKQFLEQRRSTGAAALPPTVTEVVAR